jgi:hypothetical protein
VWYSSAQRQHNHLPADADPEKDQPRSPASSQA